MTGWSGTEGWRYHKQPWALAVLREIVVQLNPLRRDDRLFVELLWERIGR